MARWPSSEHACQSSSSPSPRFEDVLEVAKGPSSETAVDSRSARSKSEGATTMPARPPGEVDGERTQRGYGPVATWRVELVGAAPSARRRARLRDPLAARPVRGARPDPPALPGVRRGDHRGEAQPWHLGVEQHHRQRTDEVRRVGSLHLVAAVPLDVRKAWLRPAAGPAPGSATRACTCSWAPSDTRRRRDHVQTDRRWAPCGTTARTDRKGDGGPGHDGAAPLTADGRTCVAATGSVGR